LAQTCQVNNSPSSRSMSSVKTTLVEVTIATKTGGGTSTASSICIAGNREEKTVMPEMKSIIGGSVKELLQELRENVTAHNMTDLVEFVEEYGMRRVAKEPPLPQIKVERNIELLKDECMKLKHEAVRTRLEIEEMVKQLKVEKDSVDNLESQIVKLKKIISNLSINNTVLLGIVLENFDSMDLISNLEHEESLLADQLRKERFYSSELQYKLQAVDAEIAALKLLKEKHGCRGYSPCLSLVRCTPLAMAPSFQERQELQFHPVMLELAQTMEEKTQDHGDGRTQMEEVDQCSQGILDNDRLTWSESILDCTTTTTETKFCLGLEKTLEITEYLTE